MHWLLKEHAQACKAQMGIPEFESIQRNHKKTMLNRGSGALDGIVKTEVGERLGASLALQGRR